MDLRKARSLIEPVIRRANDSPDFEAVIFIAEDGATSTLSAEDFHRRALAYAHALQVVDLNPGDLVVLVLKHSEALVSAFWGALYLGGIPSIFPFLTEKLDPELYMQRVRALIEHERVSAVITFEDFKAPLERLLANTGCRVVAIENVPLDAPAESASLPQIGSDRIAFLQHSSGTTGLQKGVALSHRAVLNQIVSYSKAIELTNTDVVVSWLPLYHDMGLIAGFVMPIVAGNTLVLMSPLHWVRTPVLLFETINRYKGTLCWLPNFAYNHCVRSIRQRDMEGLDLSSWRAAINCSEPVRLDSHRQFVARFVAHGFREEALSASYAMAENTFAVTQTPIGNPPHVDWVSIRELSENRIAQSAQPEAPGTLPVVSCGPPVENCAVEVIGEDGKRLPERNVGELVVRSDSMLTGYYARPDLTAEVMLDGWYRTGDMGYIADGQVYVSGRKKDLIIASGKNVYPQDLEAIANDVPGIHAGRAVAFGVMDERSGTEAIVMVAEKEGQVASGDDTTEIARELRRRVAEQTDVILKDVRVVGERWLIKTSSGKIARNDNRQKYMEEFH